jgi:general secretion pathway protein L
VLRLWRGASGIVVLTIAGGSATFRKPTDDGLTTICSAEVSGGVPILLTLAIQKELTAAAGKDYQIYFAIPAQEVLQRALSLPAVVAENLRQTLAFELDRYTPFRPDQVYFDYRLGEASNAGGTLCVDLAVVQRSVLEQHVAGLAVRGIKVSGVVLADDFGKRGGSYRNLLPSASIPKSRSGGLKRKIIRISLSTFSVVVLAAALVLPIWQKRSAAIALIAPVAEAKAAAKEADALRDRLDRLSADHNFLPSKKWDGYSAVRIIDELSKLLPDDTFLMQFDFDGKTVQITGETGSSTSMIEAIEASPMFKDVAFKSPTVKIQGTPLDRFHVGAILEGASLSLPPQVAGAGGTPAAASPSSTASSDATKAAPVPSQGKQ